MTAVHSLRLAAQKFPSDSEERKLLNWAEMQVGDFLDRIAELEEENRQLIEDKRRRMKALDATRRVLDEVIKMILSENFEMPDDVFAKDLAPFRNVMAFHGVAPAKKGGA